MRSTQSLVLACLLSVQTLAQSARTKICNVEPSKGTEDSSPAILAAVQGCTTDAVIVFKEGAIYNAFTPIVFPPLTNVEIRMGGIIHLPKLESDIPTVQKIVGDLGGKMWWFKIQGTNIDWIGSSNPNNGWIEGHGQMWYDKNPVGAGGLPNRPKLLQFKTLKGSLQHFKVRRPIGWTVSLDGSDITISDAIIDAASLSSRFPFNTDGFAVNGPGITITNSKILNGDDAVTIHDGTHDFVFKDSVIGFETHGMSIGSLGKDPTKPESISNLLFKNITMQGGLYGARFKSWAGGKGLVKNVTWTGIKMTNVTFPVLVTQIYQDQSVAKNTNPTTSAVMMEDFTFSDISGTINSKNPGDGSCISQPCWYYQNLPPLKHNEAVIINCANAKSCANFKFSGFTLKTDAGASTSAICENVGTACATGPFGGKAKGKKTNKTTKKGKGN